MLLERIHRIKGFTTLEVIIVLVLIGIFSVVSIAWYSDQGSTTLRTRADALISHLRYAQMRSMNTNSSWGIGYEDSSNNYWLYKQDPDDLKNLSDRHLLPGENQDAVRLDAVSLSHDFRVAFDSWGRPSSDQTFSDGRLSLNLQMTGQPDLTIGVVEETGFIQ
jgi:Tfp pilus assembly protein FimT